MTSSSELPVFILHHFIHPVSGDSHTSQLEDCYRQLNELLQEQGLSSTSVLNQTIFVSANNLSQFLLIKENLLLSATNFFLTIPATTILAEPPENTLVAIEFSYYSGTEKGCIKHHTQGEDAWIVLEHETEKLVFASVGVPNPGYGEFKDECMQVFMRISDILESEGMDFSNVMRQWNYIEQITENEHTAGGENQHYQIFNDVRSKSYGKLSFQNGYPAATGIGCDFGGISIEVIAGKLTGSDSLFPIKSPVQKDAYSYTLEVLAENNSLRENKTTPKFERAKVWKSGEEALIFISGTAAIKGQESDRHSAAHQTEMTIQNILQLISSSNLNRNGLQGTVDPSLSFLRVYVKKREDMAAVKQVCSSLLPTVPAIYVVADICRPELLVEIEGWAILKS